MGDRWFKVDTSIVRNPKVLQLSRTQRWALIELWAYAAEDLTDGVISRPYCDQMIGKRLRNVLLDQGFLHWIEPDKTLQIHDYLEHQQSRADVLAVSEKRRQAGRKGGKAKAEKARQPSSKVPDPMPSNEPAPSSSKIVADQDQDKEHYLRSVPTSPKSARAHDDGDDPHAVIPARLPARARRDIARELNATARSAEADRFVREFAATLDGSLDRRTHAEVAQVVDELMRDHLPLPQIAAGLVAWQRSDSWSPTQIRRFVAKAATTAASIPTDATPTKATQRAAATLAATERLIAERRNQS